MTQNVDSKRSKSKLKMMLEETCPCGSTDYRIIFKGVSRTTGKKYEIVQCKRCELALFWPPPYSQDNFMDFYQKEDDLRNRTSQIELWRKFSLSSLCRLKKIKESGRLLDVGCNFGSLVFLANNLGFDAQGIDIDRKAIEYGQKKFSLENKIYVQDLYHANFPVESFDVITMIHVLEHILELDRFLRETFGILKKRGIILIETPNLDSLWFKLLKEKWYGLVPEEHVWIFTPKSLTNILKRNSFDIIKIDRTRNMYHQLGFNLKSIFRACLLVAARILKQGDNLVFFGIKNSLGNWEK